MDDLAEELGMSKKTLYASFPSKTALLRAVLLDKFRNVESDLDRIMARCSDDTLAALQQLARLHAAARGGNPAAVRARHPARGAGAVPS